LDCRRPRPLLSVLFATINNTTITDTIFITTTNLIEIPFLSSALYSLHRLFFA